MPVRRSLLPFALSAAVLVLTAPSALAAVRYAAPTGAGASPCNPTPCSLAVAVNGANDGDQVVVAPGAYAVKTGIKVTKAIDVGGQPGAAAPSVEDTGLAVENPGAVLHDLRLGVAGETMARAFELRAGTFAAQP